MNNHQLPIKKLIFLSLIIFTTYSCSKVIGINLSKHEVKLLDTIYYKKKSFKVYDTEWFFLEKNICQFSTSLIRKKTYTGTWSIKGDSIIADFFYQNKKLPKRKSLHIDSVKKH